MSNVRNSKWWENKRRFIKEFWKCWSHYATKTSVETIYRGYSPKYNLGEGYDSDIELKIHKKLNETQANKNLNKKQK